jgi:hypothetical protein
VSERVTLSFAAFVKQVIKSASDFVGLLWGSEGDRAPAAKEEPLCHGRGWSQVVTTCTWLPSCTTVHFTPGATSAPTGGRRRQLRRLPGHGWQNGQF